MAYLVCIEESGGRWIAHVPDLPGCYASDADREVAIKAVPAAVESYLSWCREHGLRVSGLSAPMIVAEVIRAWTYEDGVEVNAFFASDRPPLMVEEADEHQRLLAATRKDLLDSVEGLSEAQLGASLPGERWPILGILEHVANSEMWCLDRMGLALPRAELPQDAYERLEAVRAHLLSQIPTLVARQGVMTLAGETWSARKVLRRALWHERDHAAHILKLRRRLSQYGGTSA
jgi:predicted RNase H-like HicB family nuclease